MSLTEIAAIQSLHKIQCAVTGDHMPVLYHASVYCFGHIPSLASPCCARWTETREIDIEAYVYTAIPYKLH